MPRPTGRDLVRALSGLGWVVVAQRGSHAHLKHPDRGGRVTVPLHAGETVATLSRCLPCLGALHVAARSRSAARAIEAIETHIAGLEADGEPVPEEVGEAQLLAVTVAA